jgi:hypothetical protein
METEWVMARVQLYRLMQEQPTWSAQRLADTLGYSLSWVKKWRKRLRAAHPFNWQAFLSQSRAPKRRHQRVTEPVVEAILALRDGLKSIYQRTVGARTILFHLQQDYAAIATPDGLPRSARTIWQILKACGRIPTRLHEHHLVPRPEPMQEWELDFGLVKLSQAGNLEFLAVVDCGTSLLVDTHVSAGFHAESALAAVAQTLVLNGLPKRIRLDRDTRLVGSWANDGYPSALIRFLQCLGVEVIVCPPRRPDLKPFVERCIRTLKHECLYPQLPASVEQAGTQLTTYRTFYNAERANQALSCANQPPLMAFPQVPALPSIPEVVDPDRWLETYDRRIFRRRVTTNGTVMVDKYTYRVGAAFAGQQVALHLDATQHQLHVQHRGIRLRACRLRGMVDTPMSFQAYLSMMPEEARSIERHMALKTRQRRR